MVKAKRRFTGVLSEAKNLILPFLCTACKRTENEGNNKLFNCRAVLGGLAGWVLRRFVARMELREDEGARERMKEGLALMAQRADEAKRVAGEMAGKVAGLKDELVEEVQRREYAEQEAAKLVDAMDDLDSENLRIIRSVDEQVESEVRVAVRLLEDEVEELRERLGDGGTCEREDF